MTLLSFLIAFGHFTSEILIFGTAKISAPVLSPVIVSSTLLLIVSVLALITSPCAFPSFVALLDDSAVRLLRQALIGLMETQFSASHRPYVRLPPHGPRPVSAPAVSSGPHV